MKIIYTLDNETTCCISPFLKSGLTLEEIAAKDVPFNLLFKIIDSDALSKVEGFSTAIEFSKAEADGVGADYGVGSVNAVIGFDENRRAITRKIKIKNINGRNCEYIDASSKAIKQSIVTEIIPSNTTNVKVNMNKARDIHMGRIRGARDIKLAKLDIEQLKGEDVAEEKQTLRDLPNTFDLTSASTPEELKALWPNKLK